MKLSYLLEYKSLFETAFDSQISGSVTYSDHPSNLDHIVGVVKFIICIVNSEGNGQEKELYCQFKLKDIWISWVYYYVIVLKIYQK